MDFLFKEKILFSRYLDFCAFDESKNFKTSEAIIGIAAQ